MSERLLTRRRFVQVAGVGTALGIAGGSRLSGGRAADSGDSPLFRFLQWNDVHVDATQPPGYRLANKKMAYLVDWANANQRSPSPDLVIGVGDMIHGGVLAGLGPDIEQLMPLLAGLKPAFYPVIGNHENVQQEGDPSYEAPFCKAFGEDRSNYTVKHKGLLFVMLNDSGAPMSNSSDVGKRRNDWFADILEGTPDVPKIICCHIPLVPIRDEPVLKKSFGFISYVADDKRLLALVDEHADSIVAVLSGHLHLTGVVIRNGVRHIVISGTASYPCDFASYDVFPDRIRVRVQSVPEDLLTRDTNIHGKPRHKVDYTDAAHPTHESYIKGNPSERDFEIALPVGKTVAQPR